MDSLLNTYLTLLKMSENDPLYESMLFNYETTTKDEFRNGAIWDAKPTVYKEKPTCLRLRPPPLKDMQTLTDWKTPGVPLELLTKPKEIVRTDPHKPQEIYMELEDLDKESVRASRPRLVMTPAVSMDDIKDDNQRELLTKEMYATSTKRAMQLGLASLNEQSPIVVAPLPRTPAPANPVGITQLRPPYVSPEWRMDSVSWDNRQRRAHCDPCKEFYLARPLLCQVCHETAARELKKKMLKKTQ